jgi:hypothetical protein
MLRPALRLLEEARESGATWELPETFRPLTGGAEP